MSHARATVRLVRRLERAGWRVRHGRRSSNWLAWPPDPSLPPVTIHETQACGIEDRNLVARLAKSGWTEGVT